jgi:hypothetical protein
LSALSTQIGTVFEIGLPVLFIVIMVALRQTTVKQDAYRVTPRTRRKKKKKKENKSRKTENQASQEEE